MSSTLTACLLGLAVAASAMLWAANRPPSADAATITPLAKANNQFALDLYGRLRTEPGNLFFSPTSISTALAMTYTGARGQTADQMAAVLHFPPVAQKVHAAYSALIKAWNAQGKSAGYQLRLANAIW